LIWSYDKEDYLILIYELGLILYLVSFVLLLPLGIAIFYKEYVAYSPFLAGSIAAALLGTVFRLVPYVYFNFFSEKEPFERKHAIGMVVLSWPLISIPSAIPLYFLANINPETQDITFLDAFFEGISGWTTTGLTTFGGQASDFYYSVNFWRHFMQYLGGLGIVVMGLLILMPLRDWEDTMELISASGRDYRIAPSLLNTVKTIAIIYFGLMLGGTLLFRLSGMPLFDSFCHSMSGFSTGGYSVKSNSLMAYDSTSITLAALPIMVIGQTNFVLIYYLLKGKIKTYFRDIESQTFWSLLIFFIAAFFVIYAFEFQEVWFSFGGRNVSGFLDVVFNVVSALTTTGWNSVNYDVWRVAASPVVFLIIILSMIIGANTSSTGGGLKAMRVGVMIKTIYWHIQDIVLPRSAVLNKKYHHLESKFIKDSELLKMFVFVFIYFIILFASFIIFLLYGYPAGEALFEVTSAIGTVGLSSGVTAVDLEPILKLVLSINMWLGRIEVLPLLYFIKYTFGKKF